MSGTICAECGNGIHVSHKFICRIKIDGKSQPVCPMCFMYRFLEDNLDDLENG